MSSDVATIAWTVSPGQPAAQGRYLASLERYDGLFYVDVLTYGPRGWEGQGTSMVWAYAELPAAWSPWKNSYRAP
jgi:hypothetical protein